MPAEKRTASPQKGSPKKSKKASPEKKKNYHMNVNHCLDKKVEVASLMEMMKLPVGMLEGVGKKTEEHLNDLGIKTVKDMGTWKFYKISKAISLLALTEESGFRHDKARMNIDGALDKKFETKTLYDISKSSPVILQGLGPKAEAALNALHLNTIEKLSSYKFFERAEALVDLSQYESK